MPRFNPAGLIGFLFEWNALRSEDDRNFQCARGDGIHYDGANSRFPFITQSSAIHANAQTYVVVREGGDTCLYQLRDIKGPQDGRCTHLNYRDGGKVSR